MFRLIILMHLFFFSGASPGTANEYSYHSWGSPPFPFSASSVATMTFDGPDVRLTVRPLEGYPNEPFVVFGTNDREGEIIFSWPARNGRPAQERTFTKSLTDSKIYWHSTEGTDYISRPRLGRMSRAAAILSHPWGCGTPYGGVQIVTRANADLTAINDVLMEGWLDSPLVADDRYPIYAHYVQGKEIDNSRYAIYGIGVPIGTEAQLAIRLRVLPEILYADLADGGGCGGAEIGYLVVPAAGLAADQTIDAMRFARAMERGLTRYLSQGIATSNVEMIDLRRSILEPFPPMVKFRIKTPSQMSRQIGDTWDSFELIAHTTFALPELTEDEIGIVLWAERLKTGTRQVRPGIEAPRDEYIDEELTAFDEAVVAYLMAKSIATELLGRCEFFLDIYSTSRADMDRIDALPQSCSK